VLNIFPIKEEKVARRREIGGIIGIINVSWKFVIFRSRV